MKVVLQMVPITSLGIEGLSFFGLAFTDEMFSGCGECLSLLNVEILFEFSECFFF